jgi:hypothetical protein
MIYRNADEALRRRRDELVLERQVEVAALPEAISSVYVRRRARSDAGVTGIACAALLVLAAALRHDGLTTILHGSWLCILGVYFFSRAAARHQLRRTLLRSFNPTLDADEDVRRLSELRPAGVVKALAETIEWRSIALPMTALAMLVPLSLHWVAAAALGFGAPDTREFDGWISLSLLCVGHCHIVLAAQAWRFANVLQATPDVFSVGLHADRAGWQAWGVTVASSVVAGLLFLVVVPVGVALAVMSIAGIALIMVVVAPAVVAVTGLAFVPTMFTRMGRKVREERLLLAYPRSATAQLG